LRVRKSQQECSGEVEPFEVGAGFDVGESSHSEAVGQPPGTHPNEFVAVESVEIHEVAGNA